VVDFGGVAFSVESVIRPHTGGEITPSCVKCHLHMYDLTHSYV